MEMLGVVVAICLGNGCSDLNHEMLCFQLSQLCHPSYGWLVYGFRRNPKDLHRS